MLIAYIEAKTCCVLRSCVGKAVEQELNCNNVDLCFQSQSRWNYKIKNSNLQAKLTVEYKYEYLGKKNSNLM